MATRQALWSSTHLGYRGRGGRILSSHFLPLNELHCESLVPVGLLEFYLTPSS